MSKVRALQFVSLVFVFALAAGTLPAQESLPSAKSTVRVGEGRLLGFGVSADGWETVIGNPDPSAPGAMLLKTSQQKDLVFGVALQCALYTSTTVRSKGGEKDTSSAEASISVRVLLDPGTPDERVAAPGEVVFSRRYQELSATLQGIIENLAAFQDGVFDPESEYLTEEEISLVLETLSANAFFFALDDVGSGVHNIVIQARVETGGSSEAGSYAARGMIGLGSVMVEEQNLVKGDPITIE